jgi:DNA-binding NtrC family response regulator
MVATANVSFYKKFLAGKVFPNSFLGFDQVIHLPSLTRRFEDLEILVPIIVKEVKSNYSQANRDICLDEIDGFHFYNWPGNVAELKQVIFELLTKDTPRWVGKYEIKEFLEERRMNGSGDFYMKQNLGEYRE